MSKSLHKVASLRHAVAHSTAIATVAGAIALGCGAIAGFSPFLLAALLIPLAEFVAAYRFRTGNGVAPQEARFFLLALHGMFLTSLCSHLPAGLPQIAAGLQYLATAFVALGIGAFWFRARILEAVGPAPEVA